MVNFIQDLILLLFCVSLFGYTLAILREKTYMKKDIIFIDNKDLTKEDVNEIDYKIFVLKETVVRSGDEIKVTTLEKTSLEGIIVGFNRANKAIHIITSNEGIKKLKRDEILKFKVKGKYGKFFNH